MKIDPHTGQADIYPLEEFKKLLDINLIAPVYWALEMIGRSRKTAPPGLKGWNPDEGMQGSWC